MARCGRVSLKDFEISGEALDACYPSTLGVRALFTINLAVAREAHNQTTVLAVEVQLQRVIFDLIQPRGANAPAIDVCDILRRAAVVPKDDDAVQQPADVPVVCTNVSE